MGYANGMWQHARYFLFAATWLALNFSFSNRVDSSPLWVLILGVAIAGLPILLYGLYRITIRRIHGLSAYHRSGALYRLLNGRIMASLLWIFYSIVFGFFALFWFSTFTLIEWLLAVLSVPAVLLTFLKFRELSAGEFRPFIVTHRALQLTTWVAPLTLTLLYLILLLIFKPAVKDGATISSLLGSVAATPLTQDASLLAQLANRWAEYYHQVRAFVSNQLFTEGLLASLIIVFSTLAMFFNLTLAFSAMLVTPAEYRRVINPLEDRDVPAPVSVSASARATAVFVVLFFFVFARLLVSIENALTALPALPETVMAAEQQAIRNVEQIENRYFEVGTIAAVESARLNIDLALEESKYQVALQAQLGFASLRGNVEAYLDHYYSLPAEYLRLGAMLTSNLEQELQNDLNSYLAADDPFAAYQQAIDQLLATNARLRDAHQVSVAALLASNEIDSTDSSIRVVEERSLDSLALPAIPEITLLPENGTDVRAGAGAISAVIASTVVAKLTAKGSLKLAVQAMSKAAVAKATSGAAGAAAGGAIGSVVPGAGTLAGAAVGAIIGIMVGVGVDALLLQVEESLNRAEFREQILSEIDNEERLLLQRLEA
ncbi:MAG: hypothetical protein KJN90_06235 [Gammaproteobacteria bacterium]|nr:hypothetical protein [Gammaproteobacteria bacterium]